ncbi:MAG: MazG nucleotide pyrophosphohydrolase domain-containing protein, partial [Halanaerobacter sp.]
FGEDEVETATEVMEEWEKIKAAEKDKTLAKGLLEEIPTEFPALLWSQKVQAKAAEVGFDWPKIEGALDKVDEELIELKREIEINQFKAAKEELGDLLFAVVNLARFLEVDAETTLRETINKFKERFKHLEEQAQDKEEPLSEISLTKLEEWWQDAKEFQEGEEKNV